MPSPNGSWTHNTRESVDNRHLKADLTHLETVKLFRSLTFQGSPYFSFRSTLDSLLCTQSNTREVRAVCYVNGLLGVPNASAAMKVVENSQQHALFLGTIVSR